MGKKRQKNAFKIVKKEVQSLTARVIIMIIILMMKIILKNKLQR